MSKIVSLVKWLMKITLRSQIAKLPRMFASHYKTLDGDSERIMSRYGIRSPSGLKIAMKKHKVSTIDELAQRLEHLEVKRQIRERFEMGVRRVVGGSMENPNRDAIRRALGGRNASEKEVIRERIRRSREG